GGEKLLLIDTKKQQVITALSLPGRINALDIDPAKHLAVVAVGNGIAWIDLDKPEPSTIVDIPGAGEARQAGQVRFMRSGAAVLAIYVVRLVEYDLATR